MRVTMLTTLSGTRDGADWPARGEVADLPKDEAADMIAAGLATADIETATVAAPENAALTTKPAAARKG